IGNLASGATYTVTDTDTAILGQYANMGNVTGEYNGITVTDEDPSHYSGYKDVPTASPILLVMGLGSLLILYIRREQ
ncbi:hypothetical protein D5R95_03505, partial [Methanosalsum natronophilum]